MTLEKSAPGPTDSSVLLQVRGLEVSFGGAFSARQRPRAAVDGVDLTVERGRTLGLIGESGSGKTTVCKVLGGLVRPRGGTALLNGEDLLARRRRTRAMTRNVQMIFQDPFSSLDPAVRIGESVREPLHVNQIGTRREQRERVSEMLGLVGLSKAYLDRFPHQMSGGQLQRVAIARALALGPQLVLADEPLSALDVSIQAQVSNLLMDVQRRLGVSYLFVAHDLAAIRPLSDSIAVMYSGRIVESGDAADVYSKPKHPYTVALMSAVPEISSAGVNNRITMARSSTSDTDGGCMYRSRCWLYESLGRPSRCSIDDPTISDEEGHDAACHYSADINRQPVYQRILTSIKNA
jgi:oligopeptide transport system ATP-binding protein